ncbi:MAG TPA: ExeM/NucH family extracellular endonuclease [Pyrinomonadaceae bacterium]|nr:ExeM/NucH family extracellular endonuclease [Pyrinomonadaceae bacterium]
MQNWTSRWLLTLLIISTCYAGTTLRVQAARPTELYFSEYLEGSSNNKALELFNGTGAPINLAGNGYNIQIFFNGATTASLTLNLTGTVANDDVYVVAHSSANAAVLAEADQTIGVSWFNGDDAIVLRKGTTILDVIGQVGSDPGSGWGSGLVSTVDHTLRRKADICGGDTNSGNAFDPSAEWEGFPNDTFAGLGSHNSSCASEPTIVSTNPAGGATNVAINTNLTITFSEPVNATGIWLSLVGQMSGSHGANVSGGPVSYTIDPDRDFASGESVTVTVFATRVSDQDTTPNNLAADFSFNFTIASGGSECGATATRIHAIQGNGLSSPLNDTANIVIEGIVVGDYQEGSQFHGFYVQEEDADADSNPATSEGIFVFDNNLGIQVKLGDKVRVKGTVNEFATGGGTSLTQLTSISGITLCGSGLSVTPASASLPVANMIDWERFEGMLIRVPQTLTVTDTFGLGRFGEVGLSVGGRLRTPTHAATPGAAASAMQDLNNRSRILLDDGDSRQNIDPTVHPAPGLSATNTLRLGATVDNLTGVLEQRFSGYRIQPVGPIAFTAANPRPAAPTVGGTLKVASFNVLNYFNGNGTGGGFPTPRGATTAQEFTRQRDKIINAITTLNADIVSLIEIENDSGANSAIADLLNGLNAVSGAGTYTLIDTGVVGTDAIRLALIFKPAVVAPVGPFKILNTAVNPQFLDSKNRPALAQTFRQLSNGAKFTIAVNHFKSKGSPCNDISDPDTGDGQGNCNLTRTRAATALVNWLATDPTGSGDPDFLIVGDLNAYAQENPITTIKAAGYTDLIQTFLGAGAYSFNFNGESGYLDHALASASLRPQVTGAAEWHINADEPVVLDYNVEFKSPNQVNTLYAATPFRSADHDPLVVGLNLTP